MRHDIVSAAKMRMPPSSASRLYIYGSAALLPFGLTGMEFFQFFYDQRSEDQADDQADDKAENQHFKHSHYFLSK